ncbi:paired immunoglobulin-like type 2 receptor beta [Emydura macquarii macquarii]|uniref:paired immunoglobulin-like type 2 receptor beta n=1 Tax=Emydura macquarii macquarii TaxID=1129001 RepID=UPI00352B5D23
MSWELLLLLPLAGVAAQDPRYQVFQPVSVSAPAGSSVTLPCNFTYPKDIEPVRDLRVYWRRGGFHGEFIYNHTENFTHPDYWGRIALVGDPQRSRTASICIDWLRMSDANFYLCFIRLQKKNSQWEQWRNVHGTNLTVPDSVPEIPSVYGGQVRVQKNNSHWEHVAGTNLMVTGPAALGTAHLILLGLGSAAVKAGVCLAVFALGQRLGWDHGPRSAL